jgi:hypothetical protein
MAYRVACLNQHLGEDSEREVPRGFFRGLPDLGLSGIVEEVVTFQVRPVSTQPERLG